MRYLAIPLMLVAFGAQAQTPAPVTGFQFSAAPCDAGALSAGGWCVDVVTAQITGGAPVGPPIVPPTAAPGTPVVNGPSAITAVGKQVIFTGTANAGNSVAIYIDNNLTPGLVVADSAGFWTMPATASFAKGNHIATARQWNSIGASGLSPPLAFTVGP